MKTWSQSDPFKIIKGLFANHCFLLWDPSDCE